MGLSTVTLGSSDNTVSFTNCPATGVIEPSQNASSTCTVHKSVTQAEFDAREAEGTSTLAVTVAVSSATSRTGLTVTHAPVTLSGLELPVTRDFTVTTSIDQTEVTAKGEPHCVC